MSQSHSLYYSHFIMKLEDLLMQSSQHKTRRTALEQEVEKLQHRLTKELKLNSVLRYALKGPVLYFPPSSSFLPLKAQTLLAELEVVEKEIICLESKLKRLKISLYKEKKLKKEAEVMQQRKCLKMQLPCKLHTQEERKALRIWSPFCKMQNAIIFSKTHVCNR